MASPLLDVRAIDAFYGDFQALFGVSLRVNAGEVDAVIIDLIKQQQEPTQIDMCAAIRTKLTERIANLQRQQTNFLDGARIYDRLLSRFMRRRKKARSTGKRARSKSAWARAS